MRSALLLSIALLAACDARPPAPSAALAPANLLERATGTSFDQVLAPRRFDFPADHGSHPGYRTEWWYFTGNLEAAAGRHYGFELTFFRFALGPSAAARASKWGTTQAWMAHLAITDPGGRRFVAEERLAREALMLAGAEARPFKIWVRDWSAQSDGRIESAPIQLAANGERIALALELRAAKPVVPHGDRGMDDKGPDPGEASYYYSLPRLDAAGTLRIDDTYEEVTGLAWLDREWSSGALDEALTGWDWFALQLDDGTDVMFYRLRRREGGISRESDGSLIAADGTRRPLGIDEVVLEEARAWTSPASGARYPMGWRMAIPSADLTLEIEPYLDAQELDLTVRYWEGAVRVAGTHAGAPVRGHGYVEMTGY